MRQMISAKRNSAETSAMLQPGAFQGPWASPFGTQPTLNESDVLAARGLSDELSDVPLLELSLDDLSELSLNLNEPLPLCSTPLVPPTSCAVQVAAPASQPTLPLCQQQQQQQLCDMRLLHPTPGAAACASPRCSPGQQLFIGAQGEPSVGFEEQEVTSAPLPGSQRQLAHQQLTPERQHLVQKCWQLLLLRRMQLQAEREGSVAAASVSASPRAPTSQALAVPAVTAVARPWQAQPLPNWSSLAVQAQQQQQQQQVACMAGARPHPAVLAGTQAMQHPQLAGMMPFTLPARLAASPLARAQCAESHVVPATCSKRPLVQAVLCPDPALGWVEVQGPVRADYSMPQAKRIRINDREPNWHNINSPRHGDCAVAFDGQESETAVLRQEVARLSQMLRTWATQGHVTRDQAAHFLASAPRQPM